jgi:hypothetical protein
LLREEERQTAAEQPVEFGMAAGGHAEHDELADALGVGLRVRERERGPPRAAEHEPALDPEVLAHPLEVLDQVLRLVRAQIGRGVARARQALPRVSLVDKNDPVCIQVEELEVLRDTARPGPAVHHQRRPAPAVRLPVDLVSVPDVEQPAHGRLRRPQRFSRSCETTG